MDCWSRFRAYFLTTFLNCALFAKCKLRCAATGGVTPHIMVAPAQPINARHLSRSEGRPSGGGVKMPRFGSENFEKIYRCSCTSHRDEQHVTAQIGFDP